MVHLTNEDGKIYLEQYATEERVFEFSHIEPGNYLIRVIQDANANGIWDTGHYLNRQQPEKVGYYPQIIKMRANWVENHTFILQP